MPLQCMKMKTKARIVPLNGKFDIGGNNRYF